jgi:hypothetical protein
LTPGELRSLIASADVYKMALGKSARYREEALREGVLVFQSERDLYHAVVAGDDAAVARAGRRVRTENHPEGNAPDAAVAIWRRSIETFRTLPPRALVVHWEGDLDHLHWGVTEEGFALVRDEVNEFGQPGLVFHRRLDGGWRRILIGGVPLSNMHPKARDVAVNMATLNWVQTDHAYLRALIADDDTAEWEARPEWAAKARAHGWFPKPRAAILAERRRQRATPLVVEAADHWDAEIARMAGTVIQTAAYANGQTVLAKVKQKDIGFTRAELEDEIAALLEQQRYRCALTGHEFTSPCANPHLRPSLDRKDSSLGYVPGNLQVVTRAANFFKSASDEADWRLKAEAMHRMAIAMQRATREAANA